MTQTYDGTATFQKAFVYLEDDRIEVGRIGFAYTEDLSRVAYREVRAVVFHGARRGRLLVVACVLCLPGIGCLIGSAVTFGDPARGQAWIGLLVFAAVAYTLAGALAWLGRRGTATGFRVDGVHTSVAAVVSGRRATQERFKRDLLARIEAARRRAVGAATGAARPPSPGSPFKSPAGPQPA